MPYKAFIYDLDGTLIDSPSLAVERLASLGPKHGYVVTPEIERELHNAFGSTERGYLARILKLSLEAEGKLYMDWEDCDLASPSPLIAGTLALFDWHEEQGHPLCLLTARSRPTADFLLGHHGLRHRFVHATMRGDLPRDHGKPSARSVEPILERLAWGHGIAREECLLVGDSLNDLQTGRNAGIRTVIVQTGHPHAITAEHGLLEEDMIPSVAHLPAWLARHAA